MSPFQIKENNYASRSQVEKNTPTFEDNKKTTENLIFQLNQAILLGGRQTENYCVLLIKNYDTLRKLCYDVYRTTIGYKININDTKIKNEKKTETSSSDDSSGGSNEKSRKKHKKTTFLKGYDREDVFKNKPKKKNKFDAKGDVIDDDVPMNQKSFKININNDNESNDRKEPTNKIFIKNDFEENSFRNSDRKNVSIRNPKNNLQIPQKRAENSYTVYRDDRNNDTDRPRNGNYRVSSRREMDGRENSDQNINQNPDFSRREGEKIRINSRREIGGDQNYSPRNQNFDSNRRNVGKNRKMLRNEFSDEEGYYPNGNQNRDFGPGQKGKSRIAQRNVKTDDENNYQMIDQNRDSVRRNLNSNNQLNQIQTSKVISKKMVNFSVDFDRLNNEGLSKWLMMNGFESLATNLPSKIQNGHELRMMTDEELERILGISSDLDKKRLRLSIQRANVQVKGRSERLTMDWVASWIDDIGLSQYKYEFLRRNVTGPVLDNLRFKDVRQLGINSPLHQCSLKRSIQLLRHQEFHPCFLKSHANTNLRKHVIFWTIADVAAWLKNINMTKKIKYIRNSGVNGALIILEPRFNYNSMIDILKIKNKKKKKKMKTEFEKLLSSQVAQEKDVQMQSNNYMPILRNAKEEKKYADVMSTIEADDLPVASQNLGIDSKYKVPPAMKSCPIHQENGSLYIGSGKTKDSYL